MLKKLQFIDLIVGQEFYLVEDNVGDQETVFMKISPRALDYVPRNRKECRFCGTQLANWVNAIELADFSRRHFCPDRDVFIMMVD